MFYLVLFIGTKGTVASYGPQSQYCGDSEGTPTEYLMSWLANASRPENGSAPAVKKITLYKNQTPTDVTAQFDSFPCVNAEAYDKAYAAWLGQ
jgi:hypothetical protein